MSGQDRLPGARPHVARQMDRELLHSSAAAAQKGRTLQIKIAYNASRILALLPRCGSSGAAAVPAEATARLTAPFTQQRSPSAITRFAWAAGVSRPVASEPSR